jgi:Icc-related predicted phosphoesterase
VSKRILVLPDVQAKPGNDFSFLRRIGCYLVEKKPDVVVCIGDFADMSSLSSYDKGKKSFEGRRYKRDVEAAQFAMQAFLGPLNEYNEMRRRNKKGEYKPRMVLTLGNHEERISRACNDDPKLDGVLSINDLAYAEYGWEVVPFLEVVVIEGVAFSHFFASGTMGRPASSAAAQLRKTNMSCVAGHQQGKQIAYATRADGSTITSIIAGSCYEHEEEYLGAQGNRHWRGFLMLNEVQNGAFDEMWVSMNYINAKYPQERFQTPAYSMPTADEIAAGRM